MKKEPARPGSYHHTGVITESVRAPRGTAPRTSAPPPVEPALELPEPLHDTDPIAHELGPLGPSRSSLEPPALPRIVEDEWLEALADPSAPTPRSDPTPSTPFLTHRARDEGSWRGSSPGRASAPPPEVSMARSPARESAPQRASAPPREPMGSRESGSVGIERASRSFPPAERTTTRSSNPPPSRPRSSSAPPPVASPRTSQVPATVRERSSVPPAREDASRSSAPPREPSLSDYLEQAVADLKQAPPEGDFPARSRVLRFGEAALPVLARDFPGPLWIDLRCMRVGTRAAQVSPIAATLAAMGEPAVPTVVKLLSAPEWHVRLAATLVAEAIPSPALLRPLLHLLVDDEPSVGDAAFRALTAHATLPELEGMLQTLRQSLADAHAPVYWKRTAARTFGRLRQIAATPLLIEALAGEPEVKDAARDALRMLTCRDLGAFRLPWQLWWRSNKARPRELWLLAALDQDDSQLRERAFSELALATGDDLGRRHPPISREDALGIRDAYTRVLTSRGFVVR